MRVFLGRYGRRLVAIVLTVGMSTCLAACGSGAGDGAAGAAATREAADPIPVAKAAEAPAESDRPGEDWAEFLGPRQDGTSAETGLLEEWPSAGPPVLWKRQIGEGYSAPSIRGNRLVLFHRPGNGRFSGDNEVVECLEADSGKRLWKKDYPTDYIDPYGYNGGPRCAPLLTADRCYTFGAEGVLTCWKLDDGEQVWQRKTAEDFRIPPAFFGVGACPLLEDGRLIVMVGGHPEAGVVAFDAATGKTLWQKVGPETFPAPPVRIERDRPPAKLASYATPLAATIHGKRHVLCFMRPGLVSLDPATGEVNFSFWFRSTIHDSVNAARPVVAGDLVFLSAAYETGAVLLKVQPDGKGCTEIWSDVDAMQTHWSTTIHHDGSLYGFSGRHEVGSSFRCIERDTGKLMWQTHEDDTGDQPDPKDGRGRNEPKYYGRGSAILADGKFIVLGERGVLALVDVNPREFREISRVHYPEAGYPSWAAPVLSRQRLYLNVAREIKDPTGRSGHDYHLLCLDLARR